MYNDLPNHAAPQTWQRPLDVTRSGLGACYVQFSEKTYEHAIY